ncbi:DUF3817 domain-containing protein [Pseudactinotalea sp. HY158]|uniref:DUF3817 domain-containing protein n=1 Tax=Pseudactinotalea sp. HY158 TaxID=2654547 RepID=UPI001E4B6718|nr:DUF3817 domain-containing protein [Pseudactinotalea sp. HY158]
MTVIAPPQTLSPRRLYRILAVAETITWTLLIAGMILKYLLHVGDWPVRVFGLTHGVVFVAYALTALLVGVNQFWPLRQIVAAVATAIVPYATIPFDRSLERRGLLTGGWRVTATDDPRDHTRTSAALRFFLRHPFTLGLAMVVAVVAIVGILLTLGPPTQWFG